MVLIPPERLNHLLGRFRNVLSKPQFENFRSVMFGLIMSGCKEHDVKSMRDTVGETKCQSSINRFFTSPSHMVLGDSTQSVGLPNRSLLGISSSPALF